MAKAGEINAEQQPYQIDKFRDLARELEADEDEARFEEAVRKIAPKDRAQDAPEDE